MKVIVVKDYDAVSKEAFAVMKEVVTNKKVLQQAPVRLDCTRT